MAAGKAQPKRGVPERTKEFVKKWEELAATLDAEQRAILEALMPEPEPVPESPAKKANVGAGASCP